MQETKIADLIPGSEEPLEEEMAPHSSILAWRIPWTEEPGGLQSMRSTDKTAATKHAHTLLLIEFLVGFQATLTE